MNFKEFVELTRPVIGGKGGVQKYVRSLFDAILTDDGRDIQSHELPVQGGSE